LALTEPFCIFEIHCNVSKLIPVLHFSRALWVRGVSVLRPFEKSLISSRHCQYRECTDLIVLMCEKSGASVAREMPRCLLGNTVDPVLFQLRLSNGPPNLVFLRRASSSAKTPSASRSFPDAAAAAPANCGWLLKLFHALRR